MYSSGKSVLDIKCIRQLFSEKGINTEVVQRQVTFIEKIPVWYIKEDKTNYTVLLLEFILGKVHDPELWYWIKHK